MPAVLVFLLAAQAALFTPHGEKAVVLLFIRSDCPISSRYAPALEKLYEQYGPQDIDFRLVYPEPNLTAEAMEKHRREYSYRIPGVLDTRHEYVRKAGARITPEAAVLVHGRPVYLGRIDDLWFEPGRARPYPTRHDLEEVLAALAANKAIAFHRTTAVGCAIEDLP